MGLYLFTMYWYWFPLANYLGLALEPTYLAGVTLNFKVPRSFTFVSKAPKSYFAYYKTKVEEKKDDKKGPAQLSVTHKILSKQKKRGHISEVVKK